MRELLKKRAAEGDKKAEEIVGEAEGPEICDEARTYYNIFMRLSPSRRFGMAVGAIPISEIHAFCEYFGIDELFERERMLYLVGVADGAYLEELNSRFK